MILINNCYQNKMANQSEIDRLRRVIKARNPTQQEYRQSANKDYFQMRQIFVEDSSGNLPKSVEEVKKWFYKKMYVEDKFKIITPVELEHTTQSLYYYIRGEIPDFGDAD